MAGITSNRSWEDLADFDLSQPDDVLVLVERFQGEWGNGGFAQLFANWNRADIMLTPEALRLLGAADPAGVVEAAIALFPDDQDDWRMLGSDAMLNLENAIGQRLWDLNGVFAGHQPALARAVEAFELRLSEDDDL